MYPIKKKIRYEADRDKAFVQEIKEMPGCSDLSHCIQCGTCSAICPLSAYMDYSPRQIINLTRAGFRGPVLKSFTIWLCASCYSCTVECPKEIKVTDIMYALKQRAIQEGVYPKYFPIPVLAKEFLNMVSKKGRTSETRLVLRLILKTNVFKLISMFPVGLRLLRTGRLSLKSDRIQGRRQLAKILEKV